MSPDFMLLIMQVLSSLVRVCIMLPLLFWVIKKIDNITDTDVDTWRSKADARSQSIYLSVRFTVVALLLAITMA